MQNFIKKIHKQSITSLTKTKITYVLRKSSFNNYQEQKDCTQLIWIDFLEIDQVQLEHSEDHLQMDQMVEKKEWIVIFRATLNHLQDLNKKNLQIS